MPASEPAKARVVIHALSIIVLLASAAPPAVSAKPAQARETLADFGALIYGARGGIFRCFGGNPEQIIDELTDLGSPPADCWRVEIAASAPNHDVGVLIPLFDDLASDGRTKSEARRVQFHPGGGFEFRMIGSTGQRILNIELAPVGRPEGKGFAIGRIAACDLDTQRWRAVLAPAIDSIPTTFDAGYLRITAEGDGSAWFAIDRIASTGIAIEGQVVAAADIDHHAPAKSLRTAMWVWKTREILPDPKRQAALLEFCSRKGITDLFVQIPYQYDGLSVSLEMADAQRMLNASAHSRTITVHALDGHPSYVLAENHDRMSKLVAAIGAYNHQGTAAERYDAIHLDNEPYVLAEWRDENRRADIIRDYVALQRLMGEQTRGLDMKYGIDIPFWFDVKTADGDSRFTVQTPSGQEPLLDTIFAHLDNVGIMSYRERVLGNDGVVAHCQSEFTLGERMGVGVFASVELGTGPNVEPRTTFGPYPVSYFHSQLNTLRRTLSHVPGCAGIAIHYYSEYQEREAQS